MKSKTIPAIDLLDPEFTADPYPLFRKLRKETPVIRILPFDLLGATRYEQCAEILSTPKKYSSSAMWQKEEKIPGTGPYLKQASLISRDPPEHTRLRRILAGPFSLKSTEAWRPAVEKICSQVTEQLQEGIECDGLTDIAVPLPVLVISEMLGVDGGMRESFRRWSGDILHASSIGSLPAERQEPWLLERIVTSFKEFSDYFGRCVEERKKNRSDDIISLLIDAAEGDTPLRMEEVLAFSRLLLIAGNETTTGLLCNSMMNLGRNPELWKLLRSERKRVRPFIEEQLRYDSPVLAVSRLILEEQNWEGYTLPAGAKIAAMIGCANHDESVFENSENFCLDRTWTKPHLSFGKGIHMCLGAELSRMETEVCLNQLLDRFSELQVHEAAVRRAPGVFLRSTEYLPVTFH